METSPPLFLQMIEESRVKGLTYNIVIDDHQLPLVRIDLLRRQQPEDINKNIEFYLSIPEDVLLLRPKQKVWLQ